MVPGGRVRVDAGRQPLDLRVRERVALSGRRRGLLLRCCASSPLLLSSCFVLGGLPPPRHLAPGNGEQQFLRRRERGPLRCGVAMVAWRRPEIGVHCSLLSYCPRAQAPRDVSGPSL